MMTPRPANENSEMVPLWVCIRRLADNAQRLRAEQRKAARK